jgi:predicted lipoprotein with Yx(FWY)xxD motif
MSRSQEPQVAGYPRRRRGANLVMGIGVVALALAAPLTAMALATGAPIRVSSASNSALGEQVTVDAHGRTLYALSPETMHHLLCKSSECVKFWPPFTVRSSKTKLTGAPGVHGHLAIFRRSNGVLQVTLGGLPLYHYSGDHAAGEANGQGIHSFGGAWHVISATTTSNVSPTAMTPTPPAAPTPAAPMPAAPMPSYPY